VSETRDEMLGIELFPEELRSLGRAVDKRRREFTTGRACARAALSQLGIGPTAIPGGARGQPLWPPGIVGSITHCRGYCACAVARAERVVSLGIDAEANLPLEVGLLVDASNSVRDRFKFEQQAAVEFLNQTVRPKYDQAFVVGFDVTPEVTQDFTDNTEKLSIGVRSLRPGGGTAMYDALYFACRDKLMKAQHNGPVRRAIILLSDGDDNQSHVTREEAIDMAQRADVIVYTISTNLSGTSHHGDKVLERIADATGGRAYVPFQLNEVANAFAAIQEELRSQYALSYKPADFIADGRYRSIEISALGQKGLRVRTRHGYYAPNQ